MVSALWVLPVLLSVHGAALYALDWANVSGSTVALITLLMTVFGILAKLYDRARQTAERVDRLFAAFYGAGEQDRTGWFYRLTVMESRVNETWERRSRPREGEDAPGRRYGDPHGTYRS